MPLTGSQMCVRTTCWPDGLPALIQEAPFPLTSFFPTEPMPVATCRLRDVNPMQRRENSEGKVKDLNAINGFNEKNGCHVFAENFPLNLNYSSDKRKKKKRTKGNTDIPHP